VKFNFCRRCGAALKQINGHVYECADGHTIFANSNPTIGVFFVTPDDQVLLSVRGIEPRKGMLDSFGGFLDGEENFQTALGRELKEELGLEPIDYEPPQYLTSETGHYPYQGETLSVISSFFWSRLKPGVTPIPADDVAGIESFPIDQVDFDRLHDDDVRAGIRALQQVFSSD
jgi:NAD+ diphosphatase